MDDEGFSEKLKKVLKAIKANKVSSLKKKLKKKGFDINEAHGAVIFAVIESGSVEMLKLVLEAGANVAAEDKDHSTPLHRATALRKIDLIHILLANKAPVNARDVEGMTPLHLAAVSDDYVDIVHVLLRGGADVNARTKTPLHTAAEKGAGEIVKVLLENGADPFRQSGKTPYQVASGRVKHLLPASLGSRSDSPMRSRGSDKRFSVLLDEKTQAALNPELVCIEEHEAKPWMSLWMACSQNEHEVVKQILARDTVDVNHPSTDGSTPLWIAAANGHLAVVRVLVGNKFVDVDLPHAKKQTTPLFAAVSGGHLEVAQLLVDKGAAFDCTDKLGDTLLHAAAQNGHDKILSYLFSRMEFLRTVPINAQNMDGLTALHLAAAGGYDKCVQILLNQYASPDVTDHKQQTALELAIKANCESTQQLLIKHYKRLLKKEAEDLQKEIASLETLKVQHRKHKACLEPLTEGVVSICVEHLSYRSDTHWNLKVPTTITVKALRKTIAKECLQSSSSVKLYYKDDRGTLLTLEDQYDWKDFLAFGNESRIFVEKK